MKLCSPQSIVNQLHPRLNMLTIGKAKAGDDIPRDSRYVNPSHLRPWRAYAVGGSHEFNKPSIIVLLNLVVGAAIVYYLNLASVPDMVVGGVGSWPSRIDTWLSTDLIGRVESIVNVVHLNDLLLGKASKLP